MTNSCSSEGRLRQLRHNDLNTILSIRNHPEVRRYMLTSHQISAEEHALWFSRVSRTPGIKPLVFELSDTVCGFVQFNETKYPKVVDWGFYAAPTSPKGTGKKMGLAALNYIFTRTNLHKICGQALHWNYPSIAFHKSLRFTQEGILHQHHFDGLGYHDIICFGILKHDWYAKSVLSRISK